VWVFHDVRFSELPSYIRNISWGWVVLAIVADILSYVCQGWRWRLLLKPVGKISTVTATKAIYAGLFASEILPMRFGEFVRAYVVSQGLSAKVSAVFPSMLVERLFDGILLTTALGLSVTFVTLPRELRQAGDIFALFTMIGVAAFIYLVLPRDSADAATGQPGGRMAGRRIRKFFNSIAEGLRAIHRGRDFYSSFAVSIPFLALQALAFWLIMRAYGLEFSVLIGAVVFLIVHLGTAIPNAPANIGTYQFFTVVGLMVFGVDKTVATGFSIVVFVLLTAPLWFIGFIALIRSGFSLNQIVPRPGLIKEPRV